MKDLVVFGCGGHAREIIQIILDQNKIAATWTIVGLLDDDRSLLNKEIAGFRVKGGIDWLENHQDVVVCIAIGSSVKRHQVQNRIQDVSKHTFATVVHPTAWVADRTVIGEGSIIFPGAKVSCDVKIGRHTFVNLNTSISHDSTLADFVSVGPGTRICGTACIQVGAELGAAATVLPGVTVGEWSVIGAGTVVLDDVRSNSTVVGNPARTVGQRTEGWQNATSFKLT